MFYLFQKSKIPQSQQNPHDPTSPQHPKRITTGKRGVTAIMLLSLCFSGVERCLTKWLVKRKEGYLRIFYPKCFTYVLPLFPKKQKKVKQKVGLSFIS